MSNEILNNNEEETVLEKVNEYVASDHLRVLCANVDTLTNKMDELSIRVISENPDVICLQEVLPKNTYEEIEVGIELQINGYEMFKPSVMKRGVITYIKKAIQTMQLEPTEQFDESVWCMMLIKDSERILVGNVYRSPSSDTQNAQRMCSAINEMCGKDCSQLIICGDFNLKEIDWERHQAHVTDNHPASLLLDCVDDNFLIQHVTENTRFREGQASNLLDLVFTDRYDNVTRLDYEMPFGRSDHVCLMFEVMCHRNSENEGFKRKYFKGNYTEIRNDINNIDWENELRGKNTEESWEILENVVKESIERNIPMQKVGKTFKKKWMTKETMNVVKEKHKAYKKYRKLRTNESKDDYNRAKQKAIYATKKARTDFETRIANNIKENPKEFYSYVNNKTTVRSEITRDRLKEQKPGKSAGPDGIHSRVVVETQEQLVRPLTMIFNKSLKEGVVPNSWKEAEVVPIFKKGKRDDPGNYRPVSLTSICGKIMEKIVRKEIVEHLERNEISDVQHGFVQGKSCQTQLLTVTEEWTRWMEERKPFDCLYFDYKKAFDSVPHIRLMRKIENCGIIGQVQRWIKSFLQGRRQRVRVGEAVSGWKKVTSGIPQSSVLGPTLFVLFINDLPQVVESPVALFADDTKVFREIQSDEDRQKLQQDIDELLIWSKKWQLPFNESKCKVMHYGKTNRKADYNLGGVNIKEVSEEKDLGVTFDQQFSFGTNASKVVAAANSRLGQINRHFRHLDTKPFMNLYKTLVRPKVEYCMTVAQPVYKKDKEKIERVQRRATKLVKGMENKAYSETRRTQTPIT